MALVKTNFCPHIEDHTPCPEGYIQWHAWAKTMSKTHKQRKCSGCGLYVIWEPKSGQHIKETDSHE